MIQSRMLLNINVSPFNFGVTKSHVGRNSLLAVSDANDMPYCITVSYYQRRLSTTLRRMNTIIVISTQVR